MLDKLFKHRHNLRKSGSPPSVITPALQHQVMKSRRAVLEIKNGTKKEIRIRNQ